MIWIQKEISLTSKPRGFHLITQEIQHQVPELLKVNKGLAHLHIKHTSAGLTLNENADPSVRRDFETHFNRMVPEDTTLFEHNYEGSDDMTSHIKSSILGHNLTIPITNGRFNLGTWQGIYLCEHRNRARERNIVITILGEGFPNEK